MEDPTEAISSIADDVQNTIQRHDDTVSNAIIALAIVASRLIYGVGDISGVQSEEAARRLLDDTVDASMQVMRARYHSGIVTIGHC